MPRDIPGDRCVLMSTSQPAEWIQAFMAEAKSEGMTLAEWVGEACLYKLPLDVAEALCERPKRGRKRV